MQSNHLHIKLIRIAKELKKWDRKRTQEIRLKSNVVHEVIFQLDVSQGSHKLSTEEHQLRTILKERLSGFAAIDKLKGIGQECFG
jgi:hypothetical protein